MKLLEGIVSEVENQIIHYPGRIRKSESRTVHVLKLDVRGWPVRFESTKCEPIANGDHVIFAGTAYRRSFVAVAYRNLTTGAEGHENLTLWTMVGVLFSAAAVLVPICLLFVHDWNKANSVFGLIIAATLFAVVFGFFGAVGLYTAQKTWRAIKAIRKATA